MPECLASIREAAAVFTEKDWGWEIIVCDNNSTDRTSQIAQDVGARVVFEAQNQISRARNRGASMATGDWLLFVDADSAVSRGLMEELRQALDSNRFIGGGACLVFKGGSRLMFKGMLAFWNFISRRFQWAAGSFIFCRRDVFETLEGFSLQRFAGEELELSRRMKRAARREGKSLVILPKHPLETSARKLELYSIFEILSIILKVLCCTPWMTRSRGACSSFWYDGKKR